MLGSPANDISNPESCKIKVKKVSDVLVCNLCLRTATDIALIISVFLLPCPSKRLALEDKENSLKQQVITKVAANDATN